MFRLSSLSNAEAPATQDFAAFQHPQLDTWSRQTNISSHMNMQKSAVAGSASCVPPATGANAETPRRTPNRPTKQGRLKEGLRQGIWRPGGAMGPGASRGHRSGRAGGGCGPRVACHHGAVLSFPCKTTQQPTIPSLHTRCSAAEDKTRVLIY